MVDCIRRSGNLVQLTICSATVQTVNQSVSQSVSEYALTVPNSSRQYSTLPRKLPGSSVLCNTEIVVSWVTTLSISSRCRAASTTTETRSQNDAKCWSCPCSLNGCSTQRYGYVYIRPEYFQKINTNKSANISLLPSFWTMIESSQSSTETAEDIYSNSSSSRTASIRSRSGSGRVSTTDLERLSIPTAVIPPAPPSENNRSPRVYASVAEMKRMRVSFFFCVCLIIFY